MREVLSRIMVTKYHRGQELLEISERQLTSQRLPIRAFLNRTGIPSEDWLVDFLLVLRSVRQDELELNQTINTHRLRGATAYGDIFEVESVEVFNRLSVAAQRVNQAERDARNPLRYLSGDQSDLLDWVVRLQAIRRISEETVARAGISLNVPTYKLKTINLYLDWCISTGQSVLHTLLKFDSFASDDQLDGKSDIVRLNHFQLFRCIMLGRLLDDKYLSYNDYVKAITEGTSSVDEIEEHLSHCVGNLSVLDDFMRDLRIISRRSQGVTQRVIANEIGVTLDKVKQVLRTYSLSAKSRIHSPTTTSEILTAVRVVDCVRASPGISVQELSHRLEIDYELCARSIPAAVTKFVANRSDHEVAKQWTDRQVLVILRLAATFAYPLSARQYDALRRKGAFDGPSAVLVCMRFGNWTAACGAAGIDSGSNPRRDYERIWTEDGLWKIVIQYFLDPNTSGTFSNFDIWLRSKESAPSRATFRLRLGSLTIIKEEVFQRLLSVEYLSQFQSYCDQVVIAEESNARG